MASRPARRETDAKAGMTETESIEVLKQETSSRDRSQEQGSSAMCASGEFLFLCQHSLGKK